MKIADLNKIANAQQKAGHCHKCGRGFSDTGTGNATRVDPKRYTKTTADCENYCTACFYQYDAGWGGSKGSEW